MIRFAAAALAACALAAAPSLAAAENFAVRVKTSDLNLQTEAGAKTALERVHRAALSACSDVVVGTRIPRPDAACVTQVSAELVKRMNAPMVQAAFDASKDAHGQS
jgi:UrcA family protein